MTVKTMTMGPGILTVGDVGDVRAFSSQVTNARLSPKVDTGDPINVLSGESASGDRDETWTLAGTLVQDFGSADSAWEWLFTNAGDSFPFLFVPNTVGARQITGTVVVEAVELGGDVKSKPTSDFEWAVTGRPVPGAYVAGP